MFNILTIDLEDYFQVHAFSKTIKYEDWDKFECRIERNVDRLLSLLDDSSLRNRATASPQHGSTATGNKNSVPPPQSLKLQHCRTAERQHCNTAALIDNSKLNTQNSPMGTFFVLGWIAERYPDLVRRIQKEGHEIACHGYAHQLVYSQSREEFRQDVKRAKSILEDITGSEVIGYRAPSYSITNKSQWAFEVLAEEGFKYDSSIFPIRHDFYGLPQAPRFPFVVSFKGNDNFEFSVLNFELNSFENSSLKTQNPALTTPNSLFSTESLKLNTQNSDLKKQHGITAARNNSVTPSSNNSTFNTQHSTLIIEFPLSTVKLFSQNLPIAGGGYFRLFPYLLIKRGLKSINEKEQKPFIFYVHPWELDFEQPRIKEVSLKSRFRHYVNLNKTEFRFKKLLSDFQFSTIRQFLCEKS